MNSFFNNFKHLTWTWNPDKSSFETIIYDQYGNTFQVSMIDYMISEHNVKDTTIMLEKWLKKPFEFEWDNPEHAWFKVYRNNFVVKQTKKIGD